MMMLATFVTFGRGRKGEKVTLAKISWKQSSLAGAHRVSRDAKITLGKYNYSIIFM